MKVRAVSPATELESLAQRLQERDLALRVAPTSDNKWSAQLSARLEAWQAVAATGETIDAAIGAAFAAWERER